MGLPRLPLNWEPWRNESAKVMGWVLGAAPGSLAHSYHPSGLEFPEDVRSWDVAQGQEKDPMAPVKLAHKRRSEPHGGQGLQCPLLGVGGWGGSSGKSWC